jgi:putative FmdB family regulatory protein
VPTYEYQCEKCHKVFEIRQRISEPALTTHDGCGGTVKRLLSPAPFILKGEGWYVTDYPSESRKKAKDAESPKPETKGDTPKADTAKSDAAKPAASATSTGAASPSAPAKAD